ATLNLVRSRIGRAFVAVRDQDIAAEIIGINIYRYKLLAFAISSFYAGVCGVLYTYYFGIANYEQFQLIVSIDYLAMIIIGGLGSVLGSIFGAIFVTLLPIVLRILLENVGSLFFSAGELANIMSGTRLGAFGAGEAFAQGKEVVFGFQCDRTGPTATVGTVLCPGYQDYIALVNSKGGVEGYKIKVLEVDNEYKVPPAIEAHERFKKDGAVLEAIYGTPQTAALNKKLEEDKILGTSPGFGTCAAAEG